MLTFTYAVVEVVTEVIHGAAFGCEVREGKTLVWVWRGWFYCKSHVRQHLCQVKVDHFSLIQSSHRTQYL